MQTRWQREARIAGGGGRELHKLEFLHFKFCTKILYAICSVFLRICAGNNSKRPLFLMSNYWEPYIICSLIFQKWHRFCCARISRFIFSRMESPPPPGSTRCMLRGLMDRYARLHVS